MGVCYYLVNEKTEQLFDLGKGPWFLLTELRLLPAVPSRVAAFIRKEIFPPQYDSEDPKTDYEDYCKKLGEKIAEFTGLTTFQSDIRVINDCGDDDSDLFDKGWPIVESRYPQDWLLAPCPECKSKKYRLRGLAGMFLEHTCKCPLPNVVKHERWSDYARRNNL